MEKYTFKIAEYIDYIASPAEELYDENRYWEKYYYIFAQNKLAALNKLFEGSDRTIIDDNNVKIFEEDTSFIYSIVKIEIIRPGIDIIDDNIILLDVNQKELPWGSGGTEKIEEKLFSDGFIIQNISRSNTGWFETELWLISQNKEYFLLHSHGEDIYDKGDKQLYSIQQKRLKIK